MPFDEDLDLFFDTTEGFATDITVDGLAVDAIFASEYVEISIGNVPFSGEKPVLVGKHSDFTGKFGETVVIGSDSYTILDIQPDGSGTCRVILQGP